MKNILEKILCKFKGNKEVKNASWLVGGKIIQMVLQLIVGILTARFLGPSNYGLITYGAAYVAFFSSLCNLGINSVIVKNFVDHPDEEGEAIGTTLLLRLFSGLLSCSVIFIIVNIADAGEPITILIVFLCSLSLLFHIFETFNYWFQSRYQSKVVSIASLVAYVSTSIYKIVLLVLQKDAVWFAVATSVDYLVYAIVIFFYYKKYNGPRLCFSLAKAKQLLSKSYNYILAGLMVSIYGYTDKIMLKQMLDEAAVGYYSTATAVCTMWAFVLSAIIDSMYPTILKLYKTNYAAYERKNRQLYAIIFYVSIGVSILFVLFGKLAIQILYGESYLPATGPLKIVTWYTAFSYLGVARNAWVVSENKQKYLKYIYIIAAVLNILLNAILIPIWGTEGAAFASLLANFGVTLFLPFFFREMRPNCKLMIEAILLKKTFSSEKNS